MSKRVIKKIFAVILSISCLMYANMSAFAAGTGNTEAIVSVNGSVRTAVTYDADYEYTVRYDTAKNTIQMSVRDLTSGEVRNGQIVSCEDVIVPQTRATIHQDTFTNYEYDIYTGNPNKWHLERPKEAFSQYYFDVNETSSNKDRLNTYRSAVDTLNAQEIRVVSKGGKAMAAAAAAAFISGMASVSGGALTVAAITAAVAAVGATGETAEEITAMGNCCNDCLYAYMDVFNNQ